MARARDQKRSGPVLIVCHGNICRSPYAAAALHRALPPGVRERFRIDSAGFVAADRPSPPEALAVAAARGLDLAAHRSTLLTPEIVAGASLILVMNAAQRRAICREYGRARRDVIALGDLDPDPIRKRGIMDPFERSLEKYEESFGRIDRCIDVLAGSLARHHGVTAAQA